jgi:hypothetical protein
MVELRTRFLSAVVLGLVLSLSVSSASAGLITLTQSSLADLLTNPVSVAPVQTTVTNYGNLDSNLLSQAYTDGAGTYVYLFQVSNTGTEVAGNSPVELFTVWPFFGATDNTQMGWLTATPDGFLPGTQEPKSKAYVLGLSSGAQISFYFSLDDSKEIDPGNQSVVLYVKSNYLPTQIQGGVSDGGSAAVGQVTGPTPEPATLALLAFGGLGLLLRRRRN